MCAFLFLLSCFSINFIAYNLEVATTDFLISLCNDFLYILQSLAKLSQKDILDRGTAWRPACCWLG